MRFIDDYDFAAETRSEAEAILHVLQEQLAQYELPLNGSKTRIAELPVPLEPQWASAIRCFPFRAGGTTTQFHDLIGYFDTVFGEFSASRTLRFTPSPALWDSTANQVICEHLPIGHASESAWAMWLLKNLNCRLSPASARAIGTCNDSVASLMGLGLLEAGLGPTSGDDPFESDLHPRQPGTPGRP